MDQPTAAPVAPVQPPPASSSGKSIRFIVWTVVALLVVATLGVVAWEYYTTMMPAPLTETQVTTQTQAPQANAIDGVQTSPVDNAKLNPFE